MSDAGNEIADVFFARKRRKRIAEGKLGDFFYIILIRAIAVGLNASEFSCTFPGCDAAGYCGVSEAGDWK